MFHQVNLAALRINVALGLLVAFTIWATALGGADSGILLDLLRTPGFDKVVHVTVYGGLTAMAIAATRDVRLVRFIPAWPALFLIVSAIDELRQRGIPGRDFSRDDMVANVVGVSLGWVLGRTIHKQTQTGK